MRRYQMLMICTAIATLFVVAILGGCGEQAQEEIDPTLVEDTPPTDDGMAVEDVQTLGDIMSRWPASFVMDVTMPEKERGEAREATMMVQMQDGEAAKMRIESEDQPGVMMMDMTENVMYTWDEGRGEGMKLSMEDAEEGDAPSPYADANPDAKITGSETIDGVECWTAETTDEDGMVTKMWVARDTNLIKQVENDEMTATYEYSEVDTVPADAFEVPGGITMHEMPEMPQMPDMPQTPETE